MGEINTGSTSISNVMLGSTQIASIYQGSTLIWPPVVTFDAVGAGKRGSFTNPSWSHVVAPGAAVVAALGTVSGTPTAVKVGTTNMSQVASTATFSSGHLTIWVLFNAPSGAQTITATCSSSFVGAGSVSYLNANSTLRSGAVSNQTANPASGTGLTTPGCMNIMAAASANSAGSFSVLSGTSRFNYAFSSGVNYPFVMQDDGPTSVVVANSPGGFYAAVEVTLGI